MREPRFLTISQVERLHAKSIDRFGGVHGLRDRHSFESAVAHPYNVYAYTKGDLFDVAAAYAFHLSQAQAFLDGNKRTGMAAALTFLELNGVILPIADSQLYESMIAIAEKQMDRTAFANLLRQLSK